MIYQIFKGFNTAGKPIYEWHCDCKKCKNSTSPCMEILKLNSKKLNGQQINP